MSVVRMLLRCDGSSEVLDYPLSYEDICWLIDAQTTDTVSLPHLGNQPRHVMIVDDAGYDIEVVQDDPEHIRLKPVRARKPVNAQATVLYHLNCAPGTAHQIVGDVVIVPDSDFQ